MRHTNLKRSFQASLLLAGAAILCLAAALANADTPTALLGANPVTATSEKPPILLADEILRRLRRLGLNFTKNRISHPYDPLGELC